MTRYEFLYKTAGAINKDNVNQVYTLLCNLIDTSVPAKEAVNIPLSEAQYKYANKALVCIYNNDITGIMQNIRNMITLGKDTALSKSEYTKVRAILMLYAVHGTCIASTTTEYGQNISCVGQQYE